MRKALILSALALCASSASAADTGQCDAKPFTLGKPSEPASKAADQRKAQAAPEKAKPMKVAAKSKPPLLAGCKSAKAKRSG